MTDKQILSLVRALNGVGYSIVSAGLLIGIALGNDFILRVVFMFSLCGLILVANGDSEDDKKQDE